jgi:hypothetical protein
LASILLKKSVSISTKLYRVSVTNIRFLLACKEIVVPYYEEPTIEEGNPKRREHLGDMDMNGSTL